MSVADVAKPKLPHLYRIPSRQGVERWYFWRGKGHPRVRLQEAPGTAAFHGRYLLLLDAPPASVDPARPQQRTLGWLAQQWFAALETEQDLERITKDGYRYTINAALREHVIDGRPETYADIPLDRIQPRTVRNLRNRKRATPSAANLRVRTLGLMFSWAMDDDREYMASNPAADIKPLTTRKGGFHTWTVAELEQYEAKHPTGTMARLALDLLSYTGQRRSDVVLFGRQHVREGWLRYTPKKTRKHGTKVAMPICAELAASINATPCGDLTFLLNSYGRPFTAKAFGHRLKCWALEAGLPDNCTAHGMRKAAAVRAAINGASTKRLMAMFGWLSSAQVDRYTREAEVEKLSRNAVAFLKR